MNNFFQTTIPDWQNDDATFGWTEPRGDNLWNGTGRVLPMSIGNSSVFLFIRNKRGLPGAARDYFTIQLWNSHGQIDVRNLGAKVVRAGGPYFWFPLTWCRAQVKWGAHAKFRGDGFCGSGCRTYTHTYTLHLYIGNSSFNVECNIESTFLMTCRHFF